MYTFARTSTITVSRFVLIRRILQKIENVLRKFYFHLLLTSRVRQKWILDSRSLPLNERHKDLYVRIHRSHWVTLNTFPDLVAGESFNDKIQWLKLFAQDPRMVQLTDKLALKSYVVQTLGPAYVPTTYQIVNSFDDFDFSTLPEQAVLKANHDYGSVFFVHDSTNFPKKKYKRLLMRALRRTYGCSGGEWQYWPIEKKLFAEEMLAFTDGRPPPDYKFHCVRGQVMWLQYIYDRGQEEKEVIVDAEGKVMDVPFDQDMISMSDFEIPPNWNELLAVAKRLSSDFPYVRVDLYNVNGRIFVGEMTFTPKNASYNSAGNIILGKLLTVDRDDVRDPLSADIKVSGLRWF